MPEQTPSTQTISAQAKSLAAYSQEVEVIISDGRLISQGSQWGHVAISIDGRVYSRAHTKYHTTFRTTYLADNRYRDSVGLILAVSEFERQHIQAELERRVADNKEYSLFSNS